MAFYHLYVCSRWRHAHHDEFDHTDISGCCTGVGASLVACSIGLLGRCCGRFNGHINHKPKDLFGWCIWRRVCAHHGSYCNNYHGKLLILIRSSQDAVLISFSIIELVRNGICYCAAFRVPDFLYNGSRILNVSPFQWCPRSSGLCRPFVGSCSWPLGGDWRAAQLESSSVGTKAMVVRCYIVLLIDGQRNMRSFVLQWFIPVCTTETWPIPVIEYLIMYVKNKS